MYWTYEATHGLATCKKRWPKYDIVCLFCLVFYFLTVSFVFRESPDSDGNWCRVEFCRISIPETRCLLKVEKKRFELRQITLELLTRGRHVGNPGIFFLEFCPNGSNVPECCSTGRAPSGFSGTNSVPMLSGWEGGTDLSVGSPFIGCSLLSLTSVSLLN